MREDDCGSKDKSKIYWQAKLERPGLNKHSLLASDYMYQKLTQEE